MDTKHTVTRQAYAKINLGLDVVGRLPNGYHEVRMIMQNVKICDTLTFSHAGADEIIITTDKSELPAGEDNLIYKAVMLLRELSGDMSGVRIHLEKRIPIITVTDRYNTIAMIIPICEIVMFFLLKYSIYENSPCIIMHGDLAC